MPDDIIATANKFRRAILARERKAAVRLIEAYGHIWARLNKQLTKLNQEIKEARARGEVVNQAWLFRQQRYGDLLRQVDQEMRGFSGLAETTITKQQSRAVKAALGDSVALMEAAAESAGVSASFNRLPVAAVENLVGVLGNGSPLRTLLDQLPRAGRAIVEQGLIEAVALGIGPAATARKIREGLGGNLHRALTISRTETLRAYRTATIQTYQANADVVSGWYWRSSRNRRQCAACTALDGVFFPVTQPMRPHPRCRCTLIPAVRGVTVDRGIDWFRRQSAEVKRDIVGTKIGYEAVRSGELRLTDFVGLKNDPVWGDSYFQLSVKRARDGENRFPGDAPRPIMTAIFSRGPIVAPPNPPLSTSIPPSQRIMPALASERIEPIRAQPAETSILAYAQRPPRNVLARYTDLGRDAVPRVIGREVSDEELAWAVGALDDAELEVYDSGGDVFVRVFHPHVQSQSRFIRRDAEGRLYLDNSIFFKAAGAPPGVGIQSFAREVFGARNLGASRIEVYAAGRFGTSTNGYYTWARFGYNAELTAAERAVLPRGLRGVKDLHELFDRGGAEYWRVNGSGRSMVFDLRSRSKSMRRLSQYIREKEEQ